MKKKNSGNLTTKTTVIKKFSKPIELDEQQTKQAEKRICELKGRNETRHKIHDREIQCWKPGRQHGLSRLNTGPMGILEGDIRRDRK